jgi:hypothetical protein
LPAADQSKYAALMRDRFMAAKSGWATVREDFRQDGRFCSGNPADQWDDQVKVNRDDNGIPALTMDRLNPLIRQIVNQARKDRPQPKVNAGDGGDPKTADVIEGKMRHVLYESHADVAFDCAEAYCAIGGFGFYRITKEWIGDRSFVQEPRVKRVADPLMVLCDPTVQELDYSDMSYCFVPKKEKRKGFAEKFGREPIALDFEDDPDNVWGDDEHVQVAEYWWVETITHRLVQLIDGSIDIASELPGLDPAMIVNEREMLERIIHCDIVDGQGAIEENIWEGKWIPIIPVIGTEMISEGKRRYISAVRYTRDPQSFTNASFSATAERMSTVNLAPFIGPKGAFKDPKWRDGKRHFYLEYENVTAGGQPINPPERNAFEPAIVGSTSATMQGIDAVKGAFGYVDSLTRPSHADLSGEAVKRRDNQASLANVQYEDSLVQSMWHCGRVILDLLQNLTDTPRQWDVRAEDGTQTKALVTMPVEEGSSPYVPGKESEPHVSLDGEYGVTVGVGKSFDSKNEDEAAMLTNIIGINPALTTIYLPALFKRLGYEDLEQVALAAMPPQVAQALNAQKQAKDQNPAVIAAQAAQLQQQNEQLKQALQQVVMKLQTKQIETEGKLAVQDAKTRGDLEVTRMELIGDVMKVLGQQQHDAAKTMAGHHFKAVEHVAGMEHELAKIAATPKPEPKPAGAQQ